ncbi:MAG: ASKHA domain-containing protein [Candidatus Alcyoniella australis]|nr:ASKHA domain-containing protein [Candidatus Alcyoniella australis]
MADNVRVTFLPDNVSTLVERGASVLSAAVRAGVHIDAACGGSGTCGRCKVRVLQGQTSSPSTSALSADEAARGLVLACRCEVHSDALIALSEQARVEPSALSSVPAATAAGPGAAEHAPAEFVLDPPVSRLDLELPEPTLADNVGDLERVLREVKRQHGINVTQIDPMALHGLGTALREGDWRATAIVRSESGQTPRLLAIQSGLRGAGCALSLDIGTTTIWGRLDDLASGTTLATASDYNSQVSLGEDVITRIVHAEQPGGLQRLQQSVVRTINGVLSRLIQDAGIARHDVVQATVAGNTTMTHLLCGFDPRSIRRAPYVPLASSFPPLRAAQLGIELPEQVPLRALSAVSSWVGGDITAGVLASGLDRDPRLTLYVDLGTNGEIVVGNNEWMASASCSAGPAFEGGGVGCGVRAAAGAINAFRIDRATCEPMVVTIGQAPAIGVCGVGLVQMLSELYCAGLLEPNGRFADPSRSPRLRERDGRTHYVVVEAANSADGVEIVLSESDVENVLRAKAAMYAGIVTVLEQVELSVDDLQRVIIAGALGNFLDLQSCVRIGLFPDIARERFSYIGNGSLLGARAAALSREALERSERIAGSITNIELVDNARFIDNYTSALFLPHTDLSRFPSVASDRRGCGEKR